MKTSKQCPKCSSLQVAYLSYQPDIGDNTYSGRAVGVATYRGFFGEAARYIGNMEAYFCTDCGYHESYVTDPAGLDWQQISGLVMLNAPKPKSEGPFR